MADTTPEFRLSADEALASVRAGALLIDVRSAPSRGQNGELQGAVVVSKSDAVDVLANRLQRTAPEQKFVIFCGSIAGSEPVVRKLREAGIAHAYDVEGGAAALAAAGVAVVAPPKPAA